MTGGHIYRLKVLVRGLAGLGDFVIVRWHDGREVGGSFRTRDLDCWPEMVFRGGPLNGGRISSWACLPEEIASIRLADGEELWNAVEGRDLVRARAICAAFCRVEVDRIMGRVAVAPSYTLAEAVEALALCKAQPKEERTNPDGSVSYTIHVLPDPRLLAAMVACRDYWSGPPDDPTVIVTMADEEPGYVRALLCVRQRIDPADDVDGR